MFAKIVFDTSGDNGFSMSDPGVEALATYASLGIRGFSMDFVVS